MCAPASGFPQIIDRGVALVTLSRTKVGTKIDDGRTVRVEVGS